MSKPNSKYFESTHKCWVWGTPSPIDIDGYCVYFDTNEGKPACRCGEEECNCVKIIEQSEEN